MDVGTRSVHRYLANHRIAQELRSVFSVLEDPYTALVIDMGSGIRYDTLRGVYGVWAGLVLDSL